MKAILFIIFFFLAEIYTGAHLIHIGSQEGFGDAGGLDRSGNIYCTEAHLHKCHKPELTLLEARTEDSKVFDFSAY